MIYPRIKISCFRSTACGLILLALIVLPTALDAQEYRTWVDRTGVHKIEAELVTFDDAVVKLKKAKGNVISVPLSKLSIKDLSYLRSLTNQSTPESEKGSAEKRSIEKESSPKGNPAPTALVNKAPQSQPTKQKLQSTQLLPKPTETQVIPIGSTPTETQQSNLESPQRVVPGSAIGVLDKESIASESDAVLTSEQLAVIVINRKRLLDLKSNWPASGRDMLIKEIADQLNSPDKFVRKYALELIGKHRPSEHFDEIIQRITDPSFEVRWVAFEIIEDLNDERAIDPLIKDFKGEDREKISSILLSFGSQIEPKILPFLKDESRNIRLAVCSMLAKIGTEKSISDLTEIQNNDPDLLVRMQAKGSITHIVNRN